MILLIKKNEPFWGESYIVMKNSWAVEVLSLNISVFAMFTSTLKDHEKKHVDASHQMFKPLPAGWWREFFNLHRSMNLEKPWTLGHEKSEKYI